MRSGGAGFIPRHRKHRFRRDECPKPTLAEGQRLFRRNENPAQHCAGFLFARRWSEIHVAS
ncbi:MAG: hypothetical protein ACRCYS_12705, partial [Beijerinckiaceae bacterium]